MTTTIDVDALLQDMQAVIAAHKTAIGDDPGLTTHDWAREWKLSDNAANIRLRELFDADLIVSGKRTVPCMDGSRRRVPVYRAKI